MTVASYGKVLHFSARGFAFQSPALAAPDKGSQLADETLESNTLLIWMDPLLWLGKAASYGHTYMDIFQLNGREHVGL